MSKDKKRVNHEIRGAWALGLWLLLFLSPGLARSQELIYHQGWEGDGGGTHGFRQYNNQTWSQQNVWARGEYSGINGAGKAVFRLLNPTVAPCNGVLLDSCAVSGAANFKGFNGAHIITGAVTQLNGEINNTVEANYLHNGYHFGPFNPPVLGSAGNTAQTSVGFYSPKIVANNAYSKLVVSFWVKVGGELNHDYGTFRYSLKRGIPTPPIPDGLVQPEADPDFFTVAQYEPIGYRLSDDGVTEIPYELTADPERKQLVGLNEWTKVVYVLPAEAAGDTNLRVCFWWNNDNDGRGRFPALTVDELKIEGYRFAAQALYDDLYCPGDSIYIPFEISEEFYSSHVADFDSTFIAYISDSAGVFEYTQRYVLGQIRYSDLRVVGGRARGTLRGRIPQNITQIPIGGWRVRIVAPVSRFKSAVSPTVCTIFPIPTYSISPSNVNVCTGQSALLTATGGGELYRWFRNGVFVTSSNTNTFVASTPGDYYVEVIKNDCRAVSAPVRVNFVPLPPVSISFSEDTVCYRENLVNFISVSPAGGRVYAGGVWLYADAPGEYVFDSYLAGLGPHYIWYEYQDPQTGCIAKDSAFVHVILNTTPKIAQDYILQCGVGPVTIDAGVDADGYLWNTGETTRSITVNASGTYWVQISGAGKCIGGIDSVKVVYVPNQLPAPVLDKNLAEGDVEVKGTSEISPVYPTYVYVYVNGVEAGASIVRDDRTWTVTIAPLNAGDVVAARIRYDSNCDGAVDENDPLSGADVYNLPLREIPNGFSPNGDGINDTFVIIRGILSKYPNNKISIFNRWGTEIYSKDGYDNSWDAKDLPDGTYWYVLDLGDGSEVKKGFVTVMR